jgi:two-component system cell cycle response regulator
MARIVIIEDNAANLDLMVYLLRAFGHTPRGFPDGEAGLEAMRRQPPDLVLCDIQLPKLNGFEIVALIRADEQLRHLPVVGVTALAMRGDRERVLAGGFDGYIEKPIQPEAFVSQVESHLRPELRNHHSAAAGAQVAAPEKASRKLVEGRATVLAVDDIDDNLELLRTVLEHGGYRVVCARSADEALALLQRERCDLVLSDVHMPGGDGFSLFRAARAREGLRHIPFVFVSSSTVPREEGVSTSDEFGTYRLLARPVEPAQLLEIVGAALQKL